MEAVVTVGVADWWCLRCGARRPVDPTGRCAECSYMVAGREPDGLDQALAEIEAAREAAAEAGMAEVYRALVKAQLVLGYLAHETRGHYRLRPARAAS